MSAVALLLSVAFMSQRVATYNKTAERPLWMFEPVQKREFSYAGRPVSVIDERGEDGWTSVAVRYGDEPLKLRATVEPMPSEVPGLVRHQDWLRILRFAEHGKMGIEEAAAKVASGEIKDRLVLVVRKPPAGVDPSALGLAGRRKWKFDFYEFKPDGGFQVTRDMSLPERERDRKKRLAEAQARGEADPGPPANMMTPGSWQADAAMMLMPSEPLFSAAYSPGPKQAMAAVRAMGWTLTSAAFSGLAVVASVIAIASARRRGPMPAI